MTNEVHENARPHQRWVLPLLGLITLALMGRLFSLVDAHAVNLPYYDQLDFYEIFKTEASLWDVFRYQHGPHRQGLPFLGTQLLASLTDWNIRADAFYVTGYILTATALALGLRRRVAGPFTIADAAIPLLFLTPAQYGVFIHTPNASHGAGPLFFLMLFGLALTLPGRRARYTALVFLNFILLHTGFGFFAGAITPILLAIETVRDFLRGGLSRSRLALTSLALSLVSVVIFFTNYTSDGGLDRVRGTEDWTLYPKYLAAMFANVLGLKNTSGAAPSFALFAGGLVTLALIVVACGAFYRLIDSLRNPESDQEHQSRTRDVLAETCFTLTAFTLLYAAATAFGRVHLGLSGAQSTRYVPLVVPGFLGAYMALQALPAPQIRRGISLFVMIALIAASFPMRESESRFMHRLSKSKRIWIATYLETGEVRAADKAAGLRVYPFVGPRYRTAEKFAYLREHRLSFFANEPHPESAP